MAGLVGYASSDDEGEDEQPQLQQETAQVAAQAAAPDADEAEKDEPRISENSRSESLQLNEGRHSKAESETLGESSSLPKQDSDHQPPPPTIGPLLQSAVLLGPSLPPADASITNTLPDPDESQELPASPYSSNRALIQDLTLPSVPNLDIPPSPPGSPPAGANKKIDQFLQLKKKGVHFNSKLEQSAALRNPSLMDKLLDFVGIDEVGQYETTLPKELWDPRGFPEWAFRDKLSKSREKLAKEKEADRAAGGRTVVDFVPSNSSLGGAAGGVSGGLNSRGEKRKGAWK
ncbi:HCNGP-like domain-containing protein [Trichoderma evansii]